jgi:hypothetical protein
MLWAKWLLLIPTNVIAFADTDTWFGLFILASVSTLVFVLAGYLALWQPPHDQRTVL